MQSRDYCRINGKDGYPNIVALRNILAPDFWKESTNGRGSSGKISLFGDTRHLRAPVMDSASFKSY